MVLGPVASDTAVARYDDPSTFRTQSRYPIGVFGASAKLVADVDYLVFTNEQGIQCSRQSRGKVLVDDTTTFTQP